MKFNLKHLWMIIAISIAFTACKKDEPDTPPTPTPPTPEPEVAKYNNGKFIVNEGSWGQGNASISFYWADGDSVTNNAFQKTNDRVLGDGAQSMTFGSGKVFIAVQGSGKIEVVDSLTFESVATIEDMLNCRYMKVYNNKLYVTQWNGVENGWLKIYNLDDYSLIKTIDVDVNPEKMLINNQKLYVVNYGNGGSSDVISVINLDTDELVKNQTLGVYGLKDLVIDKNDKIWILCSGKEVYEGFDLVEETPAKLVKFNSQFDAYMAEFEIGETHPYSLEINLEGDVLYFGAGFNLDGIRTFNVADETFGAEKFIDINAYGFDVNKTNGNIFVCVATSYTDPGMLYRFDPNGVELGSYTVGVIPNGIGKNANMK